MHGKAIEYSKNKIVTHFENEVGPGVFQSSVQQPFAQSTKTELKHSQLITFYDFGNLAARVFV